MREWLRTELDAPLSQPIEARAERHAERRANRATKLWPSHVVHQARKRKARPDRAPRDRYIVASYRRAIARACDLAGVLAWSPHGVRHAAARRPRTAQERLTPLRPSSAGLAAGLVRGAYRRPDGPCPPPQPPTHFRDA